MAGNIRFHSKYHAQQHHTLKTTETEGFPDAASDPVASQQAPFQGPVYINGVINTHNTLGSVNGVDYSDQINQFNDPVLVSSSLSATGDVDIKGNLYVHKNIHVTENVYLSGGNAGFINLGDADTDQIKINAHIITDVMPGNTEQYNIGSSTKRWNTVYCKNIDLSGELLIGDCPNPALRVSPTDNSVLIGACSTSDPDVKLLVANGKTAIEGAFSAGSVSTFNDTVTLNADEHISPGKKHIFGDTANANEISSDSTELKISSGDAIQAVADKIRLTSPVIDTSDQATKVNISTLSIGTDLIHANATSSQVGIGTDGPDTDICLHGDVHITGTDADKLHIQSPIFSVDNKPGASTISSKTIDMTSTTRANVTGSTVKIRATNTDPESGEVGALILESDITTLTNTEELDIDTSTVNFSTQPTNFKLNSSQNAFSIDTDAIVVNSVLDRVGINKLIPGATLHVGGDVIIDGKLTVNDSNVDIEGGETVSIKASEKIVLEAPVLDFNTPELDFTSQDTDMKLKPSVDAMDIGECLLKLDAQNRRVGINVCVPTTTLAVSGTVSLSGSSTDIASTLLSVTGAESRLHPVDLLSGNSKSILLTATDAITVDTPSIDMATQPVSVNISDTVNGLNFETSLLSLDGANNRVGVGTTIPDKKLHVVGDVIMDSPSTIDLLSNVTTLSADSSIDVSTPVVDFKKPSTHLKIPALQNALLIDSIGGTSPALSIDGSQSRVGIGTSTPDSSLSIKSSNPVISFLDKNLPDEPVYIKGGGTANDLTIQVDYGDGVRDNVFRTWRDNTANKTSLALCADNGGNVGIGTNTPSSRLHFGNGLNGVLGAPNGIDHGIVFYQSQNILHGLDIDGYNSNHYFPSDISADSKYRIGTMSVADGKTFSPKLSVLANGQVGIGTETVPSGTLLAVAGRIDADETSTGSATITGLAPLRVVHTNASKTLSTDDNLYYNGTSLGIGRATTGTEGSANTPTGIDIFEGKLLLSTGYGSAYISASDVLDPGLGGTTSSGTIFSAHPGGHFALDLRNNSDSDILAIRHSSNNNEIVDTATGFIYKPNGATGQVGINADQDQLGEYSLTVNGPTNIEGTLRIGGDLLIEGDYASLELTNLEIEDKAYVINKGGSLQDSPGSGMLIEGSDEIVGYVKVKDDDGSLFQIKAPTGAIWTLDANVDSKLTMDSNLDVLGPSKINQDVTSISTPTFRSITLTDGTVDGVDITDLASQVAAIGTELDTTQTGCGLNDDGTYVASSTSVYITAATSLKDADFKIDAALSSLSTTVATLGADTAANVIERDILIGKIATATGISSALEYVPPSPSTILSSASSLANADDLLDAAVATNSAALASAAATTTALVSVMGINSDGSIPTDTSKDYIHDTTSLTNSDGKLDRQINFLQRIVGEGLSSGSFTPNVNVAAITGNHRSRLDSMDDLLSAVATTITGLETQAAADIANLANAVGARSPSHLVATGTDNVIGSTNLSDWLSGANGITISADTGDDAKAVIGFSNITASSVKSNNLTSGYLTSSDNNHQLQSTGLSPFVIGTDKQIIVADGGSGQLEKVKLSLPQDIATDSEPTLKNLTLTGLGSSTSSRVLKVNPGSNKIYSSQISDFFSAADSNKIDFSTNAATGKTILTHTGSDPTVAVDSTSDNVIKSITVDDTGHITSYKTGSAPQAAIFSTTSDGLVPGPSTDQSGDNASFFLGGNGQWSQIPGVASKLTAGKNIDITPSLTTDSATISTKDVIEATQFITTSDVALKDNICNIDGSLSLINRLQGVSFTWKNHTSKRIGFIANEVEKIIPEAVSQTGSGNKAIDYNSIISHLVEAVKSLSAQVAKLQVKD